MDSAIEVDLTLLGREIATSQAADSRDAGVGRVPLPQPRLAVEVERASKNEPAIDLLRGEAGFLNPRRRVFHGVDCVVVEVEALQSGPGKVVKPEYEVGSFFKLVAIGN
jgi:hypothetical protein